jgi:hypothetical protein
MAENTLPGQHYVLKNALLQGSDRTLLGIVLDRAGQAIGKLTHRKNRISFLYSAIVISLLILIIGLVTSILLREYSDARQKMISIEILGAVLTVASLTVYKLFINFVFAYLKNNIVDAITSESSLADLQSWLDLVCNVRLNFIFSLIYGLTMDIFSTTELSRIHGGNVGYGPLVTFCLIAFTWGISMYFLFVFLVLPYRLSQYEYHLYKDDPSSSNVITHLASLLESIVYIYAIIATVTMVFLAFVGLFGATAGISMAIMSIIVAWLPITILFIASQYALAKIISRAKQQKLDEIQTRIEQIQSSEDISAKETMEKINRLMDYHDRIKNTKGSRLDLRAILSFLNSLLLPVIGFVLTNLETIKAIFRSR